ncbi:MAG: pentapeptide repeat-containing protein, partial [Candidatus Thorarchaeota archaeon]
MPAEIRDIQINDELHNGEVSEKAVDIPPEVSEQLPLILEEGKVRYDVVNKELILRGVMSKEERDELLRLSNDKSYRKAVQALFCRSNLLHSAPLHFPDFPEKWDEEDEVEWTVEAKWITDALNDKKPVDIENAIIVGDLDLRVGEPVSVDSEELEGVLEQERINLLTGMAAKNVYLVSSPISIVGSILRGRLLAGWEDKRGDVVVFLSKTNLKKTEFLGEINNFKGATFLKWAYFVGAAFSGRASFSGARFSTAWFTEATFSGWASFRVATFSTAAVFYGATFSEANFQRATFSKANFRGAKFSKLADFSRATFSEIAYFSGATFSKLADFSRATFEGKPHQTDFVNATFEGKTSFEKTIFKGGAYFSGAKFLGDVNLQKASYSALRISWRQLKGHLDSPLRELDKNLKEIKKQAREDKKTVTVLLQEKQDGDERRKLKKENLVDWQEVYLKLIKNFEDIGDKKSAEDVFYYYRKERPKFKMERLGAVSVELAQLPPGFVFSHNLTENIHYDKEEKRLVFRGAMAEDEKDELQKLADEPQYEEAVEKLFQKSQSLPEYIVRHDWREKTLEWVEYIFFGLTCGYGVRPWRPIGVAGSLILIFTIVYLLGYYLSNTSERLERLPKGLKFPDSLTGKLKGKIHYDAEKERLT